MSALRLTGIIPLSFAIGFSTSAAMAECGIASNYSSGKVTANNDRGPFVNGRIIDLSRGAARALGSSDLAFVCVRVLKYGNQTVRLRETSFHGRLGLAARLARAAN